MTEFDLALSFLQTYIRVAVAAAEAREPVSEAVEFRRHCVGNGVRPTEERVELVRDLAGVVKECLSDDEAAESAGDEPSTTVAASRLVDGLERHGWRLAYLNRAVQT